METTGGRVGRSRMGDGEKALYKKGSYSLVESDIMQEAGLGFLLTGYCPTWGGNIRSE